MNAMNTQHENNGSTQADGAVKALIVVDVQVDFCEDGNLAVAGGKAAATAITRHIAETADQYAVIAASRDWHDGDNDNGGHFAAEGADPDFVDSWPVHCVAGEHGSSYAPELSLRHVTHHIQKGMGEPAYSAFQGVSVDGDKLVDILTGAGVTEVDIVGIATDYCVKATALDAAAANLGTVNVLLDMTAAVAPGNIDTVLDEFRAVGVNPVGSLREA